MKKITKERAECMCDALDYALREVRLGHELGLCSGLSSAVRDSIITDSECNYLRRWIRRMLRHDAYLETFDTCSVTDFSKEERYRHRKPWVEWMKQHLRETAI